MKKLTSITGWLLDTRLGARIFRFLAGLLYHRPVRRLVLRSVVFLTSIFVRTGRRYGKSPRINREQELFARSILDTVDRITERRAISREFMQNASLRWGQALLDVKRDAARIRFKEERGVEPPWALVVAPTNACNLGCPSCYAESSADGHSMPFHELDRLVSEAKRQWGIKVLVFSGGEPLLYRSESKGVLDIVERHPDLLCLVFTNGTLIDRTVARRFAALGTPTACLSVEGLRESTDARRGSGSFDRILLAMDELHDAGALTGISMTATRHNCEELFSDELLDFFFVENSIFYGFVFQYMPEGRNPDPSLMPTPVQRLWMWKRSWEVIEERRIPLFDFWNHGTLIGGCAAGGRERGYLYVDWDGNMMPCVFAPYSACNVNDVYARGGTLNDAWASPFLAEFRDWQRRHGSCDGSVLSSGSGGKLVCACPVRDHYADFLEMVKRTGAKPVGPSAEWCVSNPGFTRQMIDYGRDFASLSRPVLEREYGNSEAASTPED